MLALMYCDYWHRGSPLPLVIGGASGNMQRRRIAPVTMRFDDDFNILIESHEETQQPLDRKLPELTAKHHGDIGLADTKQSGSLDLFQATLFHDGVDLEYKLRLDHMLVRIRHTKILEHVPTAGFVCS